MSLLARLFGGASPKVVRRPAPHATPGARVVRPNNTSLLSQRGWQQKGNVWTGSYACKFGTWDGRIERRGDRFDVCIKSPPDVVRRHPKYACLHDRSGGWMHLHLHHEPNDPDVSANVSAIIAYVERLLTESFHRAGRT